MAGSMTKGTPNNRQKDISRVLREKRARPAKMLAAGKGGLYNGLNFSGTAQPVPGGKHERRNHC
ncbi:MAG: hypothetical protein HQL19_06590 [Candidatus Omnitrophica bacterium]|nr:hypothetical protein [Candidatus Omnitrophota bacterium]